MNVAIALPVLADGDAIGHDVLGMAAVLRADGHAVTLYAEKSLAAAEVLPLEALRAGDVLIYHHSHGCPAAVRAVRGWSGRAVVKYHNVTPPRFFNDSETQAAAAQGLEQVDELAAIAPFWVDSAFNGHGLPTQSWSELPPFMPTESLRALEPDAGFAGRLDDWATTLLCVGRVAPNKNLLLAVDAFAEYCRRDPAARLIVAGGHVFPDYSDAVQQRITDHDLESHVVITGRVTPSQLKALYLSADALLVTSDHEGFCVPLVEAMALGVPTVAVPTTAIPGTAGPFAKYAADAPAIADALCEIIDDGYQRERHLQAGAQRYREKFTPASIGSRFRELLHAL